MVTELDDFISIREAAKECGKHPETIRRWVWHGKLNAKKLGNQLFVEKNELISLCSSRKVESLSRSAAIKKAWELSESIFRRTGENIDIIEALDRSRDSHP